jgi:hypothetical protein
VMTPVGFCTGHERTTVWGDRERYVGSHLVTGDNGVPSHHTPWCCYWTHRPLQKGVGSSPCVGGSKNVYFDGSYARVLECNPSHVRESPAFATVSPLIHPSLGSLRGASIGATCAPRLSVVCWVCLTALVGFLTRVCSRRVADDDRNSIKAVDSTQ